MDINDYQAEAAETMQIDIKSQNALSVMLLGLSGEVGELSTEFKKKLRDGDNYKIFREKTVEELGDIMWYLSSIATIEGIELSEVLEFNARKTKERWENMQDTLQLGLESDFFDDGYDENQKLPKEFVLEFDEKPDESGKQYISVLFNGQPFGDHVRDNNYQDDYYRYHDIFHFSYVTVLGWSPVVRKLLDIKRRANEDIDEIEDGGRAWVIDEAVAAIVFEYADKHNFLEGITAVDYSLLRTIKSLTNHLEVKNRTPKEWEHAILTGFEVWRKLRDKKRGRVICNMYEKTMVFEEI